MYVVHRQQSAFERANINTSIAFDRIDHTPTYKSKTGILFIEHYTAHYQ